MLELHQKGKLEFLFEAVRVNKLPCSPGLNPTKQMVFVATLFMVGTAMAVIGRGNTDTVDNRGNDTQPRESNTSAVNVVLDCGYGHNCRT